MPSTEPEAIAVAVGVLTNADGRVLINQRPPGRVQAGKWEFPGGKIETGEDAAAALARELREELAIAVTAAHPLLRVQHDYPDKTVTLEIFRVPGYTGEPRSVEGQRLCWATPQDLVTFDFLEANVPIIHALQLPPVYGITDTRRYGVEETLGRLETALDQGLRMVQVREKYMTEPALMDFVRRVQDLCRPSATPVLVNADPEFALRVGADGVHLDQRRLLAVSRRPLPRSLRVATSCHDPDTLRRAANIGADFAVLSPVKPTISHPDATVLGWERFGAWVREAQLPVYALGGMESVDLRLARAAGAVGVAMIRGLWEASRSAAGFRDT